MNCLNRGEFLNGVLLDSLDHLDKYALDKSKKNTILSVYNYNNGIDSCDKLTCLSECS